MKKIYALGVGHNTPVLLELAEACGYEVIGLYHYNDSRTGESDHGFEIIGSFDDLFRQEDLKGKNFLLTMGDNLIRTDLSEKIVSLGGCVPTLIHPTSVVSRFAEVSPVGVYILPFTFVQADSRIGKNTILLSHVNISHTVTIGDSCFIAGGAMIGAYTTMENYVFVGQGALSISGKVSRIGERSYIGACALLTNDVKANDVIAGIPGKSIKNKTKDDENG